jgi:quercetin dioxygenase-like cupin family protein
VRAGDAIWNPLTGEKAMLVESAEESGGTRIVADFAVEAGGFVPGGEHVHDHLAEHVEVRAGRITFALDGEERTLAVGEQLTVAPGRWHRWWNAGQDEVQIRARVEPALRFEEAIGVIWDSAPTGIRTLRGAPRRCLGRWLPPAIVARFAFGGRPMPFRGSCSRRSPRLRGCGATSGRSNATSIRRRTPPPRRASVASRSR